MFKWLFHILIFATKSVANIKIKKTTEPSEKTRTSLLDVTWPFSNLGVLL